MRNVLPNDDPARNINIDLKLAALLSLILVLPFALLESLNNTINRQNAPDLLLLFGLLWLLPTAFIVILVPLVRKVRAGHSRAAANPINLVSRVALLALIAMLWGSLLFDQIPCFMGVSNCD